MKAKNCWIETYDKDGLQLLGSDGTFKLDGRREISSCIYDYAQAIKRQFFKAQKDSSYIKPRTKYIKVIKEGSLGLHNAVVVRETIMLHDLF